MRWFVRDEIIKLSMPGFPFGVYVTDEKGGPACKVADIQEQILDWCTKNCKSYSKAGGYELVMFANEEDAILFFLAFKR